MSALAWLLLVVFIAFIVLLALALARAAAGGDRMNEAIGEKSVPQPILHPRSR